MSLITKLNQGFCSGLFQGLNAACSVAVAQAPTPVDPATQLGLLVDGATIAAAVGHGTAPTFAYFHDQASGISRQVVGTTNNLTPDAGCVVATASARLGVNTVRCNSLNDQIVAAGSSVWDVTTESVAEMIVMQFKGPINTGRSVFSKRGGTGNPGIEILAEANSSMWWYVSDGTTTRTMAIRRNHDASDDGGVVIFLGVNLISDDVCDAWTNWGPSSNGPLTALTNSLTNTGTYALGAGRVTFDTADAIDYCCNFGWRGSAAEGLSQANVTAFANYLGVGVFDDRLDL